MNARRLKNGLWSIEKKAQELDPTINVKIVASTDDARNHGCPSTADLTQKLLSLGRDGPTGNEMWNGFHYMLVDVPQAAPIVTAFLQVRHAGDDYAMSVRIYADDVDNSSTFSGVDGPCERVATTAQVDWDLAADVWTPNTWYYSPSIVAVVQEMVNRPGWVANNALSIIIANNGGSNYKQICTWDNHPTVAAQLWISYLVVEQPYSYIM